MGSLRESLERRVAAMEQEISAGREQLDAHDTRLRDEVFPLAQEVVRLAHQRRHTWMPENLDDEGLAEFVFVALTTFSRMSQQRLSNEVAGLERQVKEDKEFLRQLRRD
jgi:hypothetical protein